MVIKTLSGEIAFNTVSNSQEYRRGTFHQTVLIPKELLNFKQYTFDVYFIQNQSIALLKIEEPFVFELQRILTSDNWYGDWIGATHPKLNWQINEIQSTL